MTNSSDRLDRIEAILASVAESQARSEQRNEEADRRLTRIEQVAESNARAIEAWSSRIADGEQQSQGQLETAIADTVAMIADLGRQQQDTDQRFEVFLQEARADRAEMRAAREQWQEQAQANATEHRAFTQNIQVLLAEIARLWQRVAG
jgi:hypothetical protein